MTTVRIDDAGEIWTVTIDRPEVRNAVDGPTARAARRRVPRLRRRPDGTVAVLTGAGGHFCAGADLKAASADGSAAATTARARSTTTARTGRWGRRAAAAKPVIAAVAGYAVAGGLELALWCDLRVVEETRVFGVFCRRFGVPLIDGGTVRLPRLVGEGRAHRPDPHRPPRRRRRGARASASPTASSPTAQALPPARGSRARSPRSRRCASATTGRARAASTA